MPQLKSLYVTMKIGDPSCSSAAKYFFKSHYIIHTLQLDFYILQKLLNVDKLQYMSLIMMFSSVFKVPKEMKAIIINDQKRNKSTSTDNRVKDRKEKKKCQNKGNDKTY